VKTILDSFLITFSSFSTTFVLGIDFYIISLLCGWE
jgi:hypothetical protein